MGWSFVEQSIVAGSCLLGQFTSSGMFTVEGRREEEEGEEEADQFGLTLWFAELFPLPDRESGFNSDNHLGVT